MHHRFLAAAVVAVALFFLPSPALAACCEQAHDCCKAAAASCCDHKPAAMSDISVLDLLPIDTAMATPGATQSFEIWFKRPTWVGKTILQGRFIIEHDNDRMARGEPCTHIYAYEDRDKPMATFHCTHLERERAGKNTVVLITTPDGWHKLTEFQFAGETASHGHPSVR